MRMRGHRQGSKKPDGRWQFKRNGRWFCSRSGESHKDALRRIDREAFEWVGSGSRSAMNLSRALRLYLDFRRDEDIAGSTLKDDLWAGRHLIEAFRKDGDPTVGALDGVGADVLLREWDAKPRTKKKMRALGARLYRWLKKRRWHSENPFEDSSPVKYQPVCWEEPMGLDDYGRAIAFVRGNIKVLLEVLRYTGLRPVSIRGLTWFEVDDKDGRMYILLKKAKTPAGMRPIYVEEPAASMIRTLPKESAFVFPSSSKRETWCAKHLLDVWKDAQRKAGLEPRHVYDLKHLRATELAERFGGDDLRASLAMGLASPQVFGKSYRQFDKEFAERAAGAE